MQYSIGASNFGIGYDGLSLLDSNLLPWVGDFFARKNYFQIEIVDSWNDECYNCFIHFDIEINWRCYER